VVSRRSRKPPPILLGDNMSNKLPKIDGGFVVIPKHTLKCEKYLNLSNATRLVFNAFLVDFIRDNNINPNNEIEISYSRLAYYAGVNVRSVSRAVKTLSTEGFIRVTKQGGLELNMNKYQLNKRYTACGSINAYW
jgi:hypothetical protein